MNKKILCGFLGIMVSASTMAQGGTISPYSQFGLGVLSDQSQGFSRGMNGVGQGLRMGDKVNSLNPASYSSIDSLTMVFDVGISGQLTNFKEDATKLNTQSANFDYAVASFRLFPKIGMAVGLLPVTSVGYSYTGTIDSKNGITGTYTGDGGLRQVFIGAGWKATKSLSLGVNVGYLWGDIDRSILSSGTTNLSSLKREYSVSVSNYKLDVGIQWEQAISKTDILTAGATVGIGHKLGADPICQLTNVTTNYVKSDTISNGLALPMTYSMGVAWRHDRKLVAAADVVLQKWGSIDFPDVNASGNYELRSGILKDRLQVSLGADYVPNYMNRNYFKRVHYRMGVGYALPYYYINGKEGPKEFSVSAGFGLPLQNRYNNRSVLNVSAQWVNNSASGLIRENTFRINLGLTFNERWFAKWKID